MPKLTYRQLLELRREAHEDYLRRVQAVRGRGPFSRFEIAVEDGEAVVRGLGGWFTVRFPARGLMDRDALHKRGF